ncbi:MAG: RHS repeat-associated core domain-containing protein [Fimbriimonadaceae bacterium]|nr:RHS repeat-associated core domain-containing protein [Fimbriimonadaceae bacterium]
MTTTYTYDALSRLTELENGYGESTTFEYDDLSRLTKRTLHSGQYEDFTYDSMSRVTAISLKNSSNATLMSQSYTYDNNSNVLTHTKDSLTTTYTYDDIDQLLSESRTGYSGSYTYDANGNRATRTVNSVTESYNYDNADKLTSITVGGNTTKSYSYDSAGRTTAITYGGTATNFAYDYENRITSITRSGVTTNSFSYYGLDTRVSKTDSSGSFTFKRDGVGVTAPVVGDGSAVYTPGVSERSSSTTTYMHSGIKNAEAQGTTSQTVGATRQYDAFGNLTSSSGTWNGPFGYAGGFGYQEDGDHGYKLLGHRYYDPSTGRFLTRDPIKDGRNWYSYCENNPLIFSDPNGLYVRRLLYSWIMAYETEYGLQNRRPFFEYTTANENNPNDEIWPGDNEHKEPNLRDDVGLSLVQTATGEGLTAGVPGGPAVVGGAGWTLMSAGATGAQGVPPVANHKARIEDLIDNQFYDGNNDGLEGDAGESYRRRYVESDRLRR